MKKILSVVICIAGIIYSLGCAQYVPPIGGKKDTIAPKLIKSIPKTKTLNFSGKIIELYFDELVDVSSLRQEMVVFPAPEGIYDYKAKPNGVIIKYDKPFAPNTTYTFNFRNGVKDLNERNNAKNLKIVFSTGNKIDSLSIEGKVYDLFTNKPVNEALVALYPLSDSLDIRKTKPTYFYKTDTSGFYKFENTKAGNYKMYAFSDPNNNLKYDQKSEMIAFYKDTMKLSKNISNLNFRIYKADTLKPKVQKVITRADEYSVLYNKGIVKGSVKFENKKDSIPYIVESKSIKFFNYPITSDTLFTKIKVEDSSKNILSHNQKVKFREIEKSSKKKKAETLKIVSKPSNNEDVEKELIYKFSFDVPILTFNWQKIKITSDTITVEKLEEKGFQWNNSKNEVKLKTNISANQEIKIEVPKGTFISIKGDSSELLINKHKILNPENYGLLEGKIIGEEKVNKIVQLLDESFKIVNVEQTLDKYSFKNIKPGIYFVRVIVDTNNNGEWDFGNLPKEIMPEDVIITKIPFQVKANWELKGQDISITKEKVNSK